MLEATASIKPLDMPEAPPLDKTVPLDFKLPDLKTSVKRMPHTPMGLGQCYGKQLQGFKDIQPWLITKIWDGVVPGDALLLDDVLLAVNGKPAQVDLGRQMQTVKRKASQDGYFWITRWRKGKVERCFIDFGKKIYDLTQTQVPGMLRDWKLGPLGANGWCFHRKTSEGASQDARQIIITAVEEDGPSAKILQEKDVILGIDGKDFSRDARRALAEAINEAEKEENTGT